jgi:MFS family permease
MLTAFLLGIAIGSLVAGWVADRSARPEGSGREILIFSWCQVLTGVGVVAGLVWFPEVLAAARRAEASVGYENTWGIVRSRLLEALVVMAVPAVASGASFPALVRAINRTVCELGAAAGHAYALNTLGCILGSLLTGFLFIPALGAYSSAVLIALGSILLGHRILADPWGCAPGRRRALSVAAAAAIAAVCAASALRHPRYPWPRPGLELVWSREEPAALISVWRGGLGWYLYGDDTPLSFPIGSGSSAAAVQRMQAYLPLLLHPDPRRVLVVGLGFGITSGVFAASGVADSVETVELFPGVIACAPVFREYNLDPERLPGSVMTAGDGRYYLRHAGRNWDVITSNLTGPDLPGSSALYTREFFALARGKLRPHGIFLAHAYGRDEACILKTLAGVFPHVTGWRGYHNSLYLVAGLEPVVPDRVVFDRVVAAHPFLRDALRADGIRRFRDFLALRVLDETAFRRRIDDPAIEVNTDSNPVIEYRMTTDGRDIFSAHF